MLWHDPLLWWRRRMQQRHMVRTVLQSAAILKSPDQCPVARSKQRTAFPPNYIHSLDSSHMMMTATQCSRAGGHLRSSVCCWFS